MDTSVAAELLIAATRLAGHRESIEDLKSAGCGTGFGFFQERDRAPLSLAGTREASSGEQGRNGKEDGMLKHEAGSVTRRVAPATDITPQSRTVAAVRRVLSRWSERAVEPPGFNCKVRTVSTFGAIPPGQGRVPCTLRPPSEPMTTHSGHNLTLGRLWSMAWYGCLERKP